jgi:hypothetical protein
MMNRNETTDAAAYVAIMAHIEHAATYRNNHWISTVEACQEGHRITDVSGRVFTITLEMMNKASCDMLIAGDVGGIDATLADAILLRACLGEPSPAGWYALPTLD